VIVHRTFAWDTDSEPRQRGGALWFPRMFQGLGRHDNPERFGCLYVAAAPAASVVELLVPFVGMEFDAWMLTLDGTPLALATIDVPDDIELVDLDDPEVLVREALRPSHVATRHRERTQPDALALFEAHPKAGGLKWWSIYEASWPNLTLFDRVSTRLRLRGAERLTPRHEAVQEALDFLDMT
jgi:hypothetical protein